MIKKIALIILLLNALRAEIQPYEAKKFTNLEKVQGLDQSLIETHLKLYQGYVKNTNLLLEKLQTIDPSSYEYGALKRRLGWEFDGMKLHELYFEELSSNGLVNKDLSIIKHLNKQFGSYESWKKDFISTGLMRGIGWVVLYFDEDQNLFINEWINEHDTGHLVRLNPLLILDVWEHAYISQFELDRKQYFEVFFKNLNWEIIENRYQKFLRIQNEQ